MTQPLHFTTKAIESLSAIPWKGAPYSAAACRYLIGKLREAQPFVLSDYGELLDRSKPLPEVPGLILKPPFDVVALEYTAEQERRQHPIYTASRSSKRIALAWDWRDDLPSSHAEQLALGPGIVVASISYMDDLRMWMPMIGAIHMAYDDEWRNSREGESPFRDAMAEARCIAGGPDAKGYPATAILLLYEACMALGSADAIQDTIHADCMDEVNAYRDLCFALACKNVSTRSYDAPHRLNRRRHQQGRLPLKGFHVLELNGGAMMPGAGGIGDRAGPRSHLRRGHIRRLGPDRVTWVNSTVVRGRGFVEKVYSV